MLDVEALIVFSEVITAGSFSAAAARLHMTPSGVSRTITRLEHQLGMTLMHRTTRRLDLTEEGAWLLARARATLADLADTEEQARARRTQPAGLVRVNAATPALDHLLAPLVADFLDQYPLIQLELTGDEAVVDLIEERADVAIRIGALADSTLNAKKLCTSRLRVLAAPAYLARHGVPAAPADLAQHRTLGFTAPASLNTWPLQHAGGDGWPIQPGVLASNGETVRHLALAGAGIACLSDFLVSADLASGDLVPVLPDRALDWRQPIWAVFYRQGALAPRVAALVDFLAAKLADT